MTAPNLFKEKTKQKKEKEKERKKEKEKSSLSEHICLLEVDICPVI